MTASPHTMSSATPQIGSGNGGPPSEKPAQPQRNCNAADKVWRRQPAVGEARAATKHMQGDTLSVPLHNPGGVHVSPTARTPSPHPICPIAQPWWCARLSDGEDAVATPYLSHCTTLVVCTSLRRGEPSLSYPLPVALQFALSSINFYM